MNRERVAEIMQSWLIACAVGTMHSGNSAQPFERLFNEEDS